MSEYVNEANRYKVIEKNKQVIKVKSKEIFPVIAELLNTGQTVHITVTGNSMIPFLKADRDSVELSKTSFSEVRRGDIVLVQRRNGIYVLHRVCKKKKDVFYMVGDAQQWIEGPLYPDQLITRVISVRRKDRQILCTNPIWVMLSLVWLRLKVIRYGIFKFHRMVSHRN